MSRSPSWPRKVESHNAVDFAQKRYFCTIWFFSLWKYSLNSFGSSIWVTVSNSNIEKHNKIIMCNSVCLVPHKSSQTLPCIPEACKNWRVTKSDWNVEHQTTTDNCKPITSSAMSINRNNWKEMWNWWCSQYQAPQATPFNPSNCLCSAFNL